MIKYLFIFLLTVLPICGQEKGPSSRAVIPRSIQPNQGSQNKNPEPQPEKSPAITFVDNEQTNQAPNPTDEGSPSFYTAIKNPEWWLFLAALATLVVIGKQAREMAKATEEMKKSTAAVERQANILERQTKAVEDSVSLQKTLKKQWVNLENWAIKGEQTPSNKRTPITLTFNVVNPTDMLLELKHIEIYLLDGNQISNPNKPLAPGKSHFVFFEISLSERETHQYFNGLLRLAVFGSVGFKDNFGDRRNQIFGHVCIGGVNGFHFSEFEGWLDSDDDESDENLYHRDN